MVKTDDQLTLEAEQIQNETNKNANSQIRVGAHLINLVESKVNNDKIDPSPALNTPGKTIPGRDQVKAYIDERLANLQNNSNYKFAGYFEDEADINNRAPFAEDGTEDGTSLVNLETDTYWLFDLATDTYSDSGRPRTTEEMDPYPVPGSFGKSVSSGGVDERLAQKSNWNHVHAAGETWLVDILAEYIKSSSFDFLFWERLKVSIAQGDGAIVNFNNETRLVTISLAGSPGGSITIKPTVEEGDGNAVSGDAVFQHTKQFSPKELWETSELVGSTRTFDFANVPNPRFEISPTADETWEFVNVPLGLTEFINLFVVVNYAGISDYTATLPVFVGKVHKENGKSTNITEIPFPSGKSSGFVCNSLGFRNSNGDWIWIFGEQEGGAIGLPIDISDVTGLQAELDAKQDTLVSGTNIKTINGNSLLGSGNISIVSGDEEYVEAANLAALPATGSTDVLYVTIDNGNMYRWTGSVYAQVGGSTIGDASTTVAGKVEKATPTEFAAGTSTGGTGAPLVVTPDLLPASSKSGSYNDLSDKPAEVTISGDFTIDSSGAATVSPTSAILTQSGSKLSATASGTDTYTAAISPAITALVNTMRFFIRFTNANTGAATLNLNGLGAIAIKKAVSTALVAGDILAGQILCLAYDGTNFQIVGANASGVGGSVSDGDKGDVVVSGGVWIIDNNVVTQAKHASNGFNTLTYASSISVNLANFKTEYNGSLAAISAAFTLVLSNLTDGLQIYIYGVKSVTGLVTVTLDTASGTITHTNSKGTGITSFDLAAGAVGDAFNIYGKVRGASTIDWLVI